MVKALAAYKALRMVNANVGSNAYTGNVGWFTISYSTPSFQTGNERIPEIKALGQMVLTLEWCQEWYGNSATLAKVELFSTFFEKMWRTAPPWSHFFLNMVNRYASNKKIVKVASNFFTNMNAIQGWGRGDFRTVSHK